MIRNNQDLQVCLKNISKRYISSSKLCTQRKETSVVNELNQRNIKKKNSGCRYEAVLHPSMTDFHPQNEM